MIVQLLAVTATVLSGLCAGIFYAFSTGVMPGLGRSDDHVFVTGMRSINRAVLNPLFIGAIFIAPLALMGTMVAAFTQGQTTVAVLFLAALVTSIAGVALVTVRGNVPLNDRLETSVERDADTRRAFEARWVRLNHVRTVFATATLVLAAVGTVAV